MKLLANLNKVYALAIPAILYNVMEPVIGLADMAILAQVPENVVETQGAVGLASGLMALLIWSLSQVRTAVSVLVSRYYGQKNLAAIKSLIPQALLVSFLIGLISYVITNLFFDTILMFLYDKTSPIVLDYCREYYQIRSVGLAFIITTMCLFGIFRGYQNTSYAMVVGLSGGVSNIFLNYILVLGVEGVIDPMGVSGAAYASLISSILMFVLATIFLLVKTPFNLKLTFKLNHEFAEMLKMTINMLIRTLVLNLAFVLAIRFANGYGNVKLAAYSIGMNIWLFFSFFVDGFSNAGNAISGKLLGEKDYLGLNNLAKKLVKINVLVALGLSLICAALYKQIPNWFTTDFEVIKSLSEFLWLILLVQVINSVAFTFDGIFKGLGETKALRNTLLLGTFLIFIPVIYGLDYLQFEIYAIWLAFIGWMLFRALSLVVIFRKKYTSLVKS